MVHFLRNHELSSLSPLQNFSVAGIAFNLILIRTDKEEGTLDIVIQR